MADIHKLGIVPTEYPKPNDDVITALRIALRDAKSGKLQGLALACVVYDPDSCENKQSTENTYIYTPGYEFALRTASLNLIFRMGRRVDEQSVIQIEAPLTEKDE